MAERPIPPPAPGGRPRRRGAVGPGRRARALLLAALLAAGFAAAPPPGSGDAPEGAGPGAGPRELLAWLGHEDWSVRSLAAFELRPYVEPEVTGALVACLAKEPHPYVAGCALHSLGARPRAELLAGGGVGVVPALLRWAAHAHPRVRERALALLARVAGMDLGGRVDVYEGWWPRARAALEAEVARRRAEARPPPGAAAPGAAPAATGSAAPPTPDRFYGDLERLRRHGLEVVIAMDHTGSMGPVIGAVKARALALVRRLRRYVPGLRLGLVTYDDAARVRLPLTHDEAALVKALNKVAAAGGGDLEEGVDRALAAALRQEQVGWSRRALRIVILIGDAPPHESAVPGMLRRLAASRDDPLFESPVVVHAVAATAQGVEHFPAIARATGGHYVVLDRAGSLLAELVALSFGGAPRERLDPWMAEIDALALD